VSAAEHPLESWLRQIVRTEIAAALASVAAQSAPPEWVSMRKCGLPLRTARRLVKAGKLVAAKVGRELYVRPADVAAYVASQVVEPRAVDGPDDELTRHLRAVAGGRR
jgi:hypothetical protein